MTMSKGQSGRRLLGLAVVGATLALGGAAFAEMGQPKPWEYTLQEAATPVNDGEPAGPEAAVAGEDAGDLTGRPGDLLRTLRQQRRG